MCGTLAANGVESLPLRCAQRIVEFAERALHGVHDIGHGGEPRLDRLKPFDRGKRSFVGAGGLNYVMRPYQGGFQFLERRKLFSDWLDFALDPADGKAHHVRRETSARLVEGCVRRRSICAVYAFALRRGGTAGRPIAIDVIDISCGIARAATIARPKNATENIITSIVPEWIIHVPGPKHCRENVTDEKRPKNRPEPATAMVKELVLKVVPSHSVAKPITV
jgi:hypothetical protein